MIASIDLSTILLYLMIPISSGVIGWGTNVLAIKMMFYPLEFVGKPPLIGWQGIIPARAEKMASNIVELVLSRLISVEEMFAKIESRRVAEELGPSLNKMTEQIVEEVISESYPRLWESVPRRVKDATYLRVQREMPRVIEELMKDVEDNIADLCDIRLIVMDAFARNKSLLNELFLRCGEKEFRFIGHSGFYFGCAFGLIQMTIWIFYKPWWLLPLAGLLVGYATNWLALKMIFEPLEPQQIGPFTLHGLFLKRQEEVSKEYATFFAQQILHSENIINAIIRGPASDRLFVIVQRHLKQAIDDSSGMSKPFIQMVTGTTRYIEMKNKICDRLMIELPHHLPRLYDYTSEALEVQDVLDHKLKDLTPLEFDGVLHPIFQEDEWILIAVGAVLGAIAGFSQLFFLFGG